MLIGRESLLKCARRKEVSNVQPGGLLRRRLDIRVEPEVAEHEILAAIPIHIHGGDGIPPAFAPRQTHCCRAIDEAPMLLPKDPYRHPLSDDDEIQLSIVVVVDPRS